MFKDQMSGREIVGTAISADKVTQIIDGFIKSASALTSHIQGSDLEGYFDKDFPGLIRVVQKILDLDDLAMGVLFSISDSSIGRWKAGISRPHSAVRTPICNALAAQLRAKAVKPQP